MHTYKHTITYHFITSHHITSHYIHTYIYIHIYIYIHNKYELLSNNVLKPAG